MNEFRKYMTWKRLSKDIRNLINRRNILQFYLTIFNKITKIMVFK